MRTLSAAMQIFIASQRSPQTKRAYEADLNKWMDWLSGREPSQQVAVDFRLFLESHLQPASAARVFNTCRTFYRWAQIPNPFEFIRSTKRVRNRLPKVPSDASVRALLRLCNDKRDKVIIALLLNGLRSEEVTDLTFADWQYIEEYDGYFIRVVGKGDKERIVPSILVLREAMSDYLPISNRASTWLLSGSEGKKLTTRQVQYVVEKYSGGAMRPHALRHHYATRLIRAGATPFAVADLLGHESVETTQVYVHLDLSGIIEAAAKDPLEGDTWQDSSQPSSQLAMKWSIS